MGNYERKKCIYNRSNQRKRRDVNVERIKSYVSDFVKKNCPSGSSGQVLRAAQRFGLIAAAGELAILWGIFPWIDTEADDAAKFGLNAWIRQRGGIGDHEMSNAIQRLQDFIESHEGRFMSTNSEDRAILNKASLPQK